MLSSSDINYSDMLFLIKNMKITTTFLDISLNSLVVYNTIFFLKVRYITWHLDILFAFVSYVFDYMYTAVGFCLTIVDAYSSLSPLFS